MEHNPSDFIEAVLADATLVVSGTDDVNLSTFIANNYEHYLVLISASASTGGTVVTVTAQDAATDGGTTSNILDRDGSAQTVTVDTAGTGQTLQFRGHGADEFININLVGAGGTSTTITMWVLGFNRAGDSNDIPALGTELTEVGLA